MKTLNVALLSLSQLLCFNNYSCLRPKANTLDPKFNFQCINSSRLHVLQCTRIIFGGFKN